MSVSLINFCWVTLAVLKVQRTMSSEKSEELQIKVTQLMQENERLKQRSSSEVRNIYICDYCEVGFHFFVSWYYPINNSIPIIAVLVLPRQDFDSTDACSCLCN